MRDSQSAVKDPCQMHQSDNRASERVAAPTWGDSERTLDARTYRDGSVVGVAFPSAPTRYACLPSASAISTD
jgi:hypothetical protein